MTAYLASLDLCAEHIRRDWPAFLKKHEVHLAQEVHPGKAPEHATDDVVGDFFMGVRDWRLSNSNQQIRHTIFLSRSEGQMPHCLHWAEQDDHNG